jgi:DNA-binding transcriptional MerR regulator/methylmalonyl-CoA mutase cobalamin-binding subunit
MIGGMGQRNQDEHVQYSMRVVTRLTGLSADTIRAWERRYDAVIPARTDGNTRRYSAEDVRRLGLLKEATHRGYRIGDIAKLSERELMSLATAEDEISAHGGDAASTAARPENAFLKIQRDYLEAIARFDTRFAADLLARTSTIFSPRDFVFEVVLPVLRETGDRWMRGEFTAAHEHVVTHQARNLIDSILRLSSPHPGAPKLIAATPEGQMHEFGALTGAMLAGLRGFEVLYLGAQVPAPDIAHAHELAGSDIILLSVVYRGTSREVAALAASIDEVANAAEVWVGIAEDHPVIARLERGRLLHRFGDLDIALTKLLT